MIILNKKYWHGCCFVTSTEIPTVTNLNFAKE
jgi:hypothetical protein